MQGMRLLHAREGSDPQRHLPSRQMVEVMQLLFGIVCVYAGVAILFWLLDNL